MPVLARFARFHRYLPVLHAFLPGFRSHYSGSEKSRPLVPTNAISGKLRRQVPFEIQFCCRRPPPLFAGFCRCRRPPYPRQDESGNSREELPILPSESVKWVQKADSGRGGCKGDSPCAKCRPPAPSRCRMPRSHGIWEKADSGRGEEFRPWGGIQVLF